jgi:sRNA-binding protein
MTKQAEWLNGLLAQFVEAFPRAFAKGVGVQPLKIGIHAELMAALPPGVQAHEAKRFLGWYVNRPPYLKALARGTGRIDLTGAVVDTDIPETVRNQAKERLEAVNRAPAGKPGRSRPKPKPAAAVKLNREELYAMATDAKLEVILKFSTLPNATSAGAGKMAFALKTPDGQFVTVVIGNKVWNKLVKAAQEWPGWIAAVSGTIGERTEKGFTLAGPGLQVFEKKAKSAEATPQEETTPTPASPAEAMTPPQPAAPVTVTTGAGTATVTKRAPLSLKR